MATNQHYKLLQKQNARIRALAAAIYEQKVDADISDNVEYVFSFNALGKDIKLHLVSLLDGKYEDEVCIKEAVWYGYFVLGEKTYYLHRPKNWEWIINALKDIGAVDWKFLKNFIK